MKLISLLFSVALLYAVLSGFAIFASAKGKRLHGEICKELKDSIPDEMACDQERGLDCVKNKCVCANTMYYWDVGNVEWVPEEQKCLGSTGFICNFDELIPYNSSRDDQKCASGYCDRITSKMEVCNSVFCAEKAIHQCGPPEFKYKPIISLSFNLEDLKEIIIYAIVYLFFIVGAIVTLHLRVNTILQ